MMRKNGRRGGGDVKEILGGGMERLRRQFQGRKIHTRSCVGILLRRKRVGVKA